MIKAREFWIDLQIIKSAKDEFDDDILYDSKVREPHLDKYTHVIELTPDIKRKLEMYEELVAEIEGAVSYLQSTGIQRDEYIGEPEHQMLKSFIKILTKAKAAL